MNLYQRLKPEVLVSLNQYIAKYPTLGAELIETLTNEEFVTDIRYGHVVDLLQLDPSQDQSIYDLFLDLPLFS